VRYDIPGCIERDGDWVTHGWLQQALSLFFRMRVSTTLEVGPLEFHDKKLASGTERSVP
jgi:hypothetical protein